MRNAVVLVLGFGLAISATGASALPGAATGLALERPAPPALTEVEYFCSPGFVPTYGGRCIATPARDEVELFLNEAVEAPVYHHRHRRHGLRARY